MAPTRSQTVKGTAGALAAAMVLAVPAVQKWEGRRNDPYFDIARVITVCDGLTNVPMRHYSNAECDVLLNKATGKTGRHMQDCLPVTTPTPTLAAFVVFGYNVGEDAACRSTAANRLWAGDVRGACDGLLMWNKARNPFTRKLEVSKGLSNRRADERRLCLAGAA